MKERLMEGVLNQRGDTRAVVGADQAVLYLGFYTANSDKPRDPQGLVPWTIAEARELRDWLTSVLPVPAQVGCENPDGTLNVHSENETCAVCSSAQVPCPCGYDGYSCRAYKSHLKSNEYCWRDRQAAGLAQETGGVNNG